MKALFNSQWTSTVKKTAEGVLGETIYLDTDNEFSIQVLVEPRKSFSILKATIETYRTPKGVEFCQKRELPELTGANASFEVSEALRKVTWDSKLERNLFLENTKAMIQSLVPILIEKGMGYAIDEYLRKNILNSCRFYSNLDRVKISWVDYSKDQKRFTNYFCRHQSYGVFSEDDSPGTLKLSSIFCDSFHELSLAMKINGNNMITEAQAEMLRGPDDICYEAPLESASIIGKELSPDLPRKEISSFLGGGNGCRHMTDMAYFLGQALSYHTLRNGN